MAELPIKQFEVRVPFLGFCSVLIPAESADKAIMHALRLNSYELMKGNDGSGGIGEIHFKMAVRCGELEFVAGAEEAKE